MPQDYSGQNLRGRSFKGQNLAGVDFSYADIKGANFTGAKLEGVNFKGAKAGLQRRWATILVLVSWLLAGISGFFSAYAGFLVGLIFNDNRLENQIVGWVALIILIAFFAAIIRQGINAALAGALALALALALAGALALTGAFAGAGAVAVALAVAFAGAVAVALAGAGALAFAVALAGAGAFAFALAFALAGAFAGAGSGAVIFFLLNIYIARQALKGNEKYTIIRTTTVAFAAIGGTSFRNANLTDADFTQASLKSTDFRKANLTRTCFKQVKKLDRIRPGTSYLQYKTVRQVLITGQGPEANFDRFDLRGVNLREAYLTDVSFIAADLSNACFQDTDLSRAKLVQTQLDGTDFTGATLTGAYIEDWNITHETNFTGVNCQYIYMRLPTKENPDPLRKPDNIKEDFADGDFGDFIQPIFDTLDLYHNQGVDPRAIAISFKQLAENHPDAELRIVGMEVRGGDKFLIRAKTVPEADKSQLSQEYFDNYNQLNGLSEQDIKLLLQEQGSEIHDLKKSVQSMLQSSNYTTKTILILTANPKTTTSLRLDEEVREIDAGLKRAKKREEFNLEQRWAVRVRDVSQALLDFEPQIVHFSGHGSRNDGLALEDQTGNVQLVNTEALAELFKLFTPHIECILLNACYSEVQANAIVRHIPYVIGMNKEIGDQASIEFSIGFYTALGAGKSIEFSYEFGCSAIRLAGIPEHLTPVLKKKQSSF